jgi:hypothetical protein
MTLLRRHSKNGHKMKTKKLTLSRETLRQLDITETKKPAPAALRLT